MQQPQWGASRPWFAEYYGNNPQLIAQIQGWFYSIDTDRNGHLDQGELSKALQAAGVVLQPATLTRVMRAFDLDHSGNVGINEFVCLYQFVMQTRNAFANVDRDRSGKLDNWTEIAQALQFAGFPLSQPAINAILPRFDPARTGLTLDAYTDLSVFLGNLRSYFNFYAAQQPAKPPAGAPAGQPATGMPPQVQMPTISINFDQLVCAAPYFQ